MSPQHLEDEIYLDYLTGELPAEERLFLEKHLDHCSECRLHFEQCRELLRGGLPSIADEMIDDLSASPLPWSLGDGEKRLYAAIEKEYLDRTDMQRDAVPLESLQSKVVRICLKSGTFGPKASVTLAVAASIVVGFGLANSLYRAGVKHGLEQSRAMAVAVKPVVPSPPAPSITQAKDDGALKAQLHKLALERDAIQAGLLDRDARIAQLKSQIEQQQKQNEATETSFHLVDLQAKEQTQEISSQRDDLARKLEEQQSALAATQKKLEALQQAGTNDTLRVASLENRVQQITQLLKDKDSTIDEQQRLLALDRDIRDLMSTRGLYFAEVWDVGDNGKRKKPFGRVFYTRGKSLIFYGYDLDQQPGVKNASTFQAWGMRGPDRSTALNLGPMIMYDDNSKNKHWMVRFDDPKALEQIKAVFVTVEPSGASRVPKGKEILVTYLNEAPNHP
jgi:anti-sigma factor RsiW